MKSSNCYLGNLLAQFSPLFTKPTFITFVTLVKGAILAPGYRTTTGMIRAAGGLAEKHYTTYHRFWSEARWNHWLAFRLLAKLVLAIVPGEVKLLVDDTVVRRWGRKVWGRGRHRDPVLSSRGYTVICSGHRWVTLAVAVKLPFTSRYWALPVGALLHRRKALCEKTNDRHRKPEELAKILVYKLLRYFPERRFVLIGDGGYRSADFALWCEKVGCELVSRINRNGVLYDDPKPHPHGRAGRPRKKGEVQPNFKERVLAAKPRDWQQGQVVWYQGVKKTVKWLSGTGLRYKVGLPTIRIRWVIVLDPETGEWDPFYSTRIDRSAVSIIESYVLRWSLEVTFQEAREHLGLESARNWAKMSVTRTVPCLLGLFTLISLYFRRLCQTAPPKPRGADWYQKQELTFSDALIAIRKNLWGRLIIHEVGDPHVLGKTPPKFLEFVTDRLSATG